MVLFKLFQRILCKFNNIFIPVLLYSTTKLWLWYTGVTLSICPCSMKSSLEYNVKSITARNFKLHTQIDDTRGVPKIMSFVLFFMKNLYNELKTLLDR